jgi:hypothetical protein
MRNLKKGQLMARDVVDDIWLERQRQINDECWTAEHDDQQTNGNLALAAACYAAPVRMFRADAMAGRGYETYTAYRDAWPWDDKWWKPKDRRQDLVRAAALIVAEIERMDRASVRREETDIENR